MLPLAIDLSCSQQLTRGPTCWGAAASARARTKLGGDARGRCAGMELRPALGVVGAWGRAHGRSLGVELGAGAGAGQCSAERSEARNQRRRQCSVGWNSRLAHEGGARGDMIWGTKLQELLEAEFPSHSPRRTGSLFDNAGAGQSPFLPSYSRREVVASMLSFAGAEQSDRQQNDAKRVADRE
jgi:hypothetical protein